MLPKLLIAIILLCLLVKHSQSEISCLQEQCEFPNEDISEHDIKRALRMAYRLKHKIGSEEVTSLVQTPYGVEPPWVIRGHINEYQKIPDDRLIEFVPSDRFGHRLEKYQMPLELATDILIHKFNLSERDIHHLSKLKMDAYKHLPIVRRCLNIQKIARCDRKARYRSQDGSCNNLDHPEWGSAYTCHKRMFPASYVEQSGIRQSVCGVPLPAPRNLSLNVHHHVDNPTNYENHLYVFFGQFLAHEVTYTSLGAAGDSYEIDCCSPITNNSKCAQIHASPTDPKFSELNATCINFARSAMCPSCHLGHRSSLNQNTAYIDASNIYGSKKRVTDELRSNDGTGTLKVRKTQFGDMMLDIDGPVKYQCTYLHKNEFCYGGGEDRLNQNTMLTVSHLLFHREHNRIAKELKLYNWHWDEETLFQESRKIVGAMMQVIVYNEYLPITLGPKGMTDHNLWIGDEGTTCYESKLDSGVFAEFAGAAFRFGHSMVNSEVVKGWSQNGTLKLKDTVLESSYIRHGMMDEFLEKVVESPAQARDRHLIDGLTNFAFKTYLKQYGDFPSTDIQRGRDHGLPSYAKMVKFCSNGSTVITDFDDLYLSKLMTRKAVALLQSNYRDVRDVDMWTGILCEIAQEGAVLGLIGACVVGRQFYNLKCGDRFYFDHIDQPGSFTAAQRNALKQVTYSSIICANSLVDEMPEKAMLLTSPSNKRIPCSRIPPLDLSPWSERHHRRRL